MLSWAKVIESCDDIPGAYQGAFQALPGNNRVFPYVILAPAFGKSRYQSAEKLICDIDDVFYVLESVDDQIVAKGYPRETIRDVEMGRFFLHSWITISGPTVDGVLASSTLEFNTATHRLFMPFLNKIRPAASGPDAMGLKVEQGKFDYLASMDIKFMNYARNSLTRGEKVIDILWQPAIRKRVLTLLGWPFYKTLSLAHLTILTDKEVILIRDAEYSRGNKGLGYGNVWQYIPFRSLRSASLTEETDNVLNLCFCLSPDTHLERIFAASNRREMEHFRNEIERLIG